MINPDGPVYLASPYSHKDAGVMVIRWERVCEIAANMMRKGIFVYSPIAHSHPCVKYGCPTNWEYWEQYDRKFMAVCSRMLIADIPGWTESKGVQAEIKIAQEMGLDIKMVRINPYEEYRLRKG